jgi:hypothetical protein
VVSTAITVNYEADGHDWAIEVSSGGGESRTGRACGLIAARETADRLVAELARDTAGSVRVVHLLHGDAVAFSSAYLSERLGLVPATGEDTAVDRHGPTAASSPTNHHEGDLRQPGPRAGAPPTS